jgi:hypothetical protein
LQFVRSVWNGLPTFIQEVEKEIPTEDLDENVDVKELLTGQLSVNAGRVKAEFPIHLSHTVSTDSH